MHAFTPAIPEEPEELEPTQAVFRPEFMKVENSNQEFMQPIDLPLELPLEMPMKPVSHGDLGFS